MTMPENQSSMPSAGASAVYSALRQCANSDGRSWPTIQTLAAQLGMKRETVRRAISELDQRRVIRVNRLELAERCRPTEPPAT
jgi:DNA-binding FadR family transcriptional regulator